jgi:2-aminoethylphosphonate-pyruvate transaminase
MNAKREISTARDPLLFTPGPLTTSLTVKQRMLRDIGSWHREFVTLVTDIRHRLLKLAGLSDAEGWEAVLMQGSGTYGVESVFQSCVPRHGKVAVLVNGAYGERMVQMLEQAGIDRTVIRVEENVPLPAAQLGALLDRDSSVTHVAAVHCETTTGILNPIQSLGLIAHDHGKVFIVDAMSSFGGVPVNLEDCGIDCLISSANKCIEGVPGFSFVFCKRDHLLGCTGYSRSLSLDLVAQFKTFERDGKFRFTPPTHVLMAFHQALIELEAEGGVEGRHRRYLNNHQVLLAGMARLDIHPYLKPAHQSPVITAFRYPESDEFNFGIFYEKLAARGFIIYPGKLTRLDTFRIGTIGRIFETDILTLLAAIGECLKEMGINTNPELQPLHEFTD